MTRSIILTGGGTAGHVTPNIALLTPLSQAGWQVHYIGAGHSVEAHMLQALSVPFYPIRCGKLRRYFSWQTFVEPFNIFIGMIQSYRIVKRIKPDILFSKGGFVAFPAVVGAFLNKVPVVIHESDMSPGLANRLSFPFAKQICVTFAATCQHIKKKSVVTGTPIRQQLFQGDRNKALTLCGFSGRKPCLLIIGGSLGAQAVNHCVRNALDALCQRFHVIHLCGKGKLDPNMSREDYQQFEYANEELADMFALCDVVVSRAGANSVYEILALEKPHVFIPLSAKASRGDQIQNAHFFQQQGISVVLENEHLTQDSLLAAVQDAYDRRFEIIDKIKKLNITPAVDKIMHVIHEISAQ